MKQEKLNHLILEQGISTGHKHQIKKGEAVLYSTDDKGKQVLEVLSDDVSVVHEEHNTIDLPQGEYIVRNVVEKDHLKDEIRVVID